MVDHNGTNGISANNCKTQDKTKKEIMTKII